MIKQQFLVAIMYCMLLGSVIHWLNKNKIRSTIFMKSTQIENIMWFCIDDVIGVCKL